MKTWQKIKLEDSVKEISQKLKLKVRRQESPDLTLEKVSVACGIPRPNSTVLRHHFVRAAASLAHPRWTPVNHDCV